MSETITETPQAPTIDAPPSRPRIQLNFDADPHEEAVRAASEMFGRGVDWVQYYREILGTDGAVKRLFQDEASRQAFKRTSQYLEIQQMLARLREKNPPPTDDEEPTRVITVRLPACIHQALRDEARELNTSMNKLCISKLLHVIASDLVPADA